MMERCDPTVCLIAWAEDSSSFLSLSLFDLNMEIEHPPLFRAFGRFFPILNIASPVVSLYCPQFPKEKIPSFFLTLS